MIPLLPRLMIAERPSLKNSVFPYQARLTTKLGYHLVIPSAGNFSGRDQGKHRSVPKNNTSASHPIREKVLGRRGRAVAVRVGR